MMGHTGKSIIVKAYAKINLFLDIEGVRKDGYHLVNMAMQSLGLHDTLEFKVVSGKSDSLVIDDMTGRFGSLSAGGDNLVMKAAGLMREAAGNRIPDGEALDIILHKQIPSEAGLGGGSADAAAALLGIDRLFGLETDSDTLAAMALKLGADVPFCLRGGTMRASGIGEVLSALPDMPDCGMLIAKPVGSASTRDIYRAYDGLDDPEHPSWDGFMSALGAGDLQGLCGELANVLEAVTAPMIPEIGRIKDHMLRAGALASMMTGSGSAVFGIFRSAAEAEKAAEDPGLSRDAVDVFVTSPVSGEAAARERFQ